MSVLREVLLGLATLIVLLGALPQVVACAQFALIGVHGVRNHLSRVGDFTPHVAIVVPAWNEGAVIEATVARLLTMHYPQESLRVYVVDDASTDETPRILERLAGEHPGHVFHVRRETGGQGKAHTLNAGLEQILEGDWCEAVLVIDADVILANDALRRMTRHLIDPHVGSVTAYIKEGSQPSNYLNRFVAYEYVTAQAAARRAQNVLGAMACLAGGAQLHSRANLLAIGGRIDTSSLAEDTITTFMTQQHGRLALFDGNAIVWAEEPAEIAGLWKQRVRWARGNVQVTRRYRHVWFRRARDPRLGRVSFGAIWFTTFLMPAFMIGASLSLVILYFADFPEAWRVFHALWIFNAITYLFITLMSFSIDPRTTRRAWVQGIMFPGVISLAIILASCFPPLLGALLPGSTGRGTPPSGGVLTQSLILLVYLWLSLSMLVAWAGKLIEGHARLRWLAPVLIYTAGYGALLCAITLSAYIKEARGADMRWEKTEKTGKVAVA